MQKSQIETMEKNMNDRDIRLECIRLAAIAAQGKNEEIIIALAEQFYAFINGR